MLIEALAEGAASAAEAFSDPGQTRAQTERLTQPDVIALLERRLGRTCARQRLGLERDHETRMSGGGPDLFQVENWYLAPWLIRGALRLTGLHRRARHNAERIVIRENLVRSYDVPAPFTGSRSFISPTCTSTSAPGRCVG
jgi:hypothetical protein